MDYSLSEHINFNAFPFKLRFSNNNKLYHEIKNECDELNTILLKLNIEIRDKTKIGNVLREYFVYVGIILRKALEYLAGNSDQNETKLALKSQFEEKLVQYFEDEQGSLFFSKIRETSVLVNSLPANWKCLTWQKKSALSKFGVNNNATKLKQISDDGKAESETQFRKDLDEISNTLSLVNNKIQWLRNRLHLLNEFIIYLYGNFREYLKFLLKFSHQLSNESYANDSSLQNLKNDISRLFEIELKVNFFSTASTAYKLKVNQDTICLEVKPTTASLLPTTTNARSQVNVAFISNQESKNLTALNYINEIYIDQNVHFSTNSTTQ